MGSTIRLDHCATEGQTRANNDFGCQPLSLVSGRQARNEMNDKPIGTFHLFPPELQKTAIMASKENAKNNRKYFDEALERQFKKLRMKEEIMIRKQYANATEEYVVAIYFYEQCHSPRCWKSVEEAKSTYARLASERAWLGAVKE